VHMRRLWDIHAQRDGIVQNKSLSKNIFVHDLKSNEVTILKYFRIEFSGI
jgi:hypothetical protein